MSVTLEELNPIRASFTYKNKTLNFKPFTLSAQIWVNNNMATKENPNGLEVASQRMMQMDPEVILELGYYLLEEKEEFENLEDFTNFFKNIEAVYKHVLDAVQTTIGISQPSQEKIEEATELKK